MKYCRKNHLVKMKQGFTILELLIVVIIIGALASIALPKIARLVKKTYATEAMGIFSWMHGRMELSYVSGNNSYLPAWNIMLSLGDGSIPVGISRPEDSVNAHFCYTIQVFTPAAQSYQMKAYYTDSAAVTCPAGTAPAAFMGIPDYIEYNENKTTQRITYKGYGAFIGYGA